MVGQWEEVWEASGRCFWFTLVKDPNKKHSESHQMRRRLQALANPRCIKQPEKTTCQQSKDHAMVQWRSFYFPPFGVPESFLDLEIEIQIDIIWYNHTQGNKNKNTVTHKYQSVCFLNLFGHPSLEVPLWLPMAAECPAAGWGFVGGAELGALHGHAGGPSAARGWKAATFGVVCSWVCDDFWSPQELRRYLI